MARSIKKGPYVFHKLIDKINKANESNKKSVMGKILFKSIFKIENKIVQKKYFENNKIKYFTKVFSK